MKATSTSQCDRPLNTTALVRSNRRTRSLTLSNSRWLAYATAGIASGFGLTSAAEGEIHYSGLVNVKMENSRSVTLPLRGGAAHDASLHFSIFYSSSGSLGGFWITGAELASARVYRTNSFQILADIGNGSPVSIGPFTTVGAFPQQIAWIQSFYGRGYLGPNGGGFIGFKFDIGRGAEYGWARIKVSLNPPLFFRYIIKDYAWGDPGEPIAAGQKSSFDERVSVIPGAGSLGLLALGAGGLEAWRDARGQAPTGN